MKILCIGGSADGRRIEDTGRTNMQFASIPPPPEPWSVGTPTQFPDDSHVKVSSYRREIIRSGREDIAFYVHEPMDTAVAIGMLFEKYPKP